MPRHSGGTELWTLVVVILRGVDSPTRARIATPAGDVMVRRVRRVHIAGMNGVGPTAKPRAQPGSRDLFHYVGVVNNAAEAVIHGVLKREPLAAYGDLRLALSGDHIATRHLLGTTGMVATARAA